MFLGIRLNQKSSALFFRRMLILMVFLTLVLSWVSCQDKSNANRLAEINDRIRLEYAPDKRVAIYEIDLLADESTIRIVGETDQSEALSRLKEELKQFNLAIEDEVSLLPDKSIGNHPYAVVNNSVANLRSKPKHSAELATQAILGMGLKVLKIKGDFYLVQTPDKYIAWVDHGGVKLMTEKEYEAWSNGPKVVYLKTFGQVYSAKVDRLNSVGDLVLGSLLHLNGEDDTYFDVSYPDGRRGFVRKDEAEPYLEWLKDLNPTAERLELYARSLIGSPYLWGGTSSKAMDCSGFTKTAFRMNGLIIPRDASQQILAGKDIDPGLTMDSLAKGDLMFFGKKATDSTRQRVTHVAIWLGNDRGEFIHSSGRVKIGSVDPESLNYDAFNTNRYLGSRRYLGESDPNIASMPLRN